MENIIIVHKKTNVLKNTMEGGTHIWKLQMYV